jgi:hypothetical protein
MSCKTSWNICRGMATSAMGSAAMLVATLGYGVPADIRQLDLNGTDPRFLYFDQKSTVSLIVDQLCV